VWLKYDGLDGVSRIYGQSSSFNLYANQAGPQAATK
jgi:hypothetical protein